MGDRLREIVLSRLSSINLKALAYSSNHTQKGAYHSYLKTIKVKTNPGQPLEGT